MDWLIPVDGEELEISSDRLFSGRKNKEPDMEDRLVRMAVGLPITKQLVYYKDIRKADSKVDIDTFRLAEMYHVIDRWFEMEIVTVDGETKRIHSAFLSEMQKPSFIADMAAQEQANL